MSSRSADSSSTTQPSATAEAPLVVVLGANGRLGQASCRAFLAAGWRVLAQARRPLAQGVTAAPAAGALVAVSTPLSSTAELAAAARGARAVVHAINPPYPRWRREAVPAARLAMDLAEALDARLLFPGNVYNFGAQMPAVLREDTAQQPSTSYGQLRCAIEHELEARAKLRSAVVRAGDFFGSGLGSWFDLVITRSLASGKLVYPGPLDRTHAWAYLPDLARVLVAMAGRDDLPRFSRWHFEGFACTGKQWLAALEGAAEALGLKPARGWSHGGVPWPVLRVGGLLVPTWRALADLSYLWQRPHQLDGAALRGLLGELPATPLPQALKAALLELPAVQKVAKVTDAAALLESRG